MQIELKIEDYTSGVRSLTFQHEGQDTQFWKGNYGSKMAGGVVRILFDSMDVVRVEEDENEKQ